MIVIVGAGLAGSCLARALRAQGKPALLIGSHRPHSLAALAVVRRGYHPKEQQGLVSESLSLLADWGAIAAHGGIVSNYRTATTRTDPDWTLVSPSAPLLNPDLIGMVTAVSPREVTLAGGEKHRGTVVLAPGAGSRWTPPDWKITHGYTWSHRDRLAVATDRAPVRVHHMAPYKSIVAGVVDGHARLGSSSARTQSAARAAADQMLARADAAGMLLRADGWTLEYGQRAQGPWLSRNEDGVPVIGGLHRTGYALAPALAQTLARTLR